MSHHLRHWRRLVFPFLVSLIGAVLIRQLIPVHQHGAGLLGLVAIVVLTIIVVLSGFLAIALEQRYKQPGILGDSGS